MQKDNYIYSFSYDATESDLCKLESKYIFNKEEKDKQLFSDIKIAPSSSAFIKKRIDIISSSDDYDTLIEIIKKENISAEGFKVEYLVLDGDKTNYAARLKKLKDVGYSIDGDPDYYTPTITYAICYNEGLWYFGIMIKDAFDWYKHKEKPCSYSNSISVNIAKSLINIATKANKTKTMLDACCGVGTIMLEACFAGFNIEGSDINWKVCRQARENLAHFDYKTIVYRSDIKDIEKRYDAAIIDLPYNLYSYATDEHLSHIIESTAAITDRVIIVSASDITAHLDRAGLKVLDFCSVSKRGKVVFTREIWVCEKIK